MDRESISVSLDEKSVRRRVFRSSVIADSILWQRYAEKKPVYERWQGSKSQIIFFFFFFFEIPLKERHDELT